MEIAAPERTGTLGRAFDSTAASYKLFWFLAILRLLPQASDEKLPIRPLVTEMVLIAWAPAALYRLSFGAHDRLQDLVRDLQEAQRLRPTATETRVRTALARWPGADERLDALSNLVPTRFLGPWVDLDLAPSIRDDRRTRAIIRTAREQVTNRDGPPYAIERDVDGLLLRFGPGWRDWLLNHRRVLESHAELGLTRFLQARNPHVPGISEKIRMPGARRLAPARKLFEHLRGHAKALPDAYDGLPLDQHYAIDHILPRAFVAHDLLWNLAPTRGHHNLAKGELLPDISLLEPLARFHHALIAAAPDQAGVVDDYLAVFGIDEHELRAMSRAMFTDRYLALLTPLLQIAAAQGFRRGWHPGPRIPPAAPTLTKEGPGASQ